MIGLENGKIPKRYARNMGTFTIQDQAVLSGSRACIVGLGGLGGAVTEILARIGIGNLTLIDGDVFEESNLNRQLLSTVQNLGTSKAEAAEARIRLINPAVNTRIHRQFLTPDNATHLLHGADVAVDCLDSLNTRFILEKAARAAGIPLVSAAIAGTYGQITTIFPEDPGLCGIYGPPEGLPEKGAETALGTLAYTALALASLQCSEVTKICLQRGSLLRNQLLVLDFMDNDLEILKIGDVH